MNKKIIAITSLVLFVSLIGFLFVKSADNGAKRYAKIEQAIRAIDQRNDDVDSAVLSLRLGISLDYDELSRCESDLAISERISVETFQDSEWEQLLHSQLKPLLDKKVLLSTDFKTNHAVVRNSVAGFRHKISQVQEQLIENKSTMLNQLTNLEILGARFTISGDLLDKEQFEAAIVAVESEFDTTVDSPSASRFLSFALRHARNLVDRRIELDETISNLVAVPIKNVTQRIMSESAKEFQAKSATATWFRLGLLMTIAMTIAFCFYQYFSLLRHKLLIHRANLTLEKRVEERTADLANANKELKYSIAEAEKLALVARYTDNAVVITDDEACIEWVNDGFTRNTGYSLEEVIGKKPFDFLHGPETDSATQILMKESIQQKSGFDVDVINYRKDGTPFWVSIEARPIRDDRGEIKRFIGIESDITDRVNAELEREQLNEQLVDASRLAGMTEVATGVLHNVGNILNSVNVSAEVIRKQFRKSAFDNLERISALISQHESDFASFVKDDHRGKKIPAYIAKVTETLKSERKRTSDEFHDLVANVEHIKQIVSVQQSMGKSSGVKQELSPDSLVYDAITANKGTLNSHQVEIVTEIEDDLPMLISDKHKILQILVNLIKNANDSLSEHETPHPKIMIEVNSSPEGIEFSVTDNGVGIPKDRINKIFQHGFTTKKTGHGFGLHSSANAATELGGTLSCSSPGIGEGAAFKLRLPAKRSESTEADVALTAGQLAH